MHWSSIVCTRWARRADWDQRNTGGTRMPHFIVCPICGPPHTKCVASFTGGDGHRRWVRSRQNDSCGCRLTPMQEAAIVRLAKQEMPIEHKTTDNGQLQSS